jgi:protein kinase A
VDRSARLGNLSGGAADVKGHAFFADVDWGDLYRREHEGPIVPKLSGGDDDSCFERYEEEERKVGEGLPYTEEARERWEGEFEGF